MNEGDEQTRRTHEAFSESSTISDWFTHELTIFRIFQPGIIQILALKQSAGRQQKPNSKQDEVSACLCIPANLRLASLSAEWDHMITCSQSSSNPSGNNWMFRTWMHTRRKVVFFLDCFSFSRLWTKIEILILTWASWKERHLQLPQRHQITAPAVWNVAVGRAWITFITGCPNSSHLTDTTYICDLILSVATRAHDRRWASECGSTGRTRALVPPQLPLQILNIEIIFYSAEGEFGSFCLREDAAL